MAKGAKQGLKARSFCDYLWPGSSQALVTKPPSMEFFRSLCIGGGSNGTSLEEAQHLFHTDVFCFSEPNLGQRTTVGQPNVDVRIAKAPNTT